MYDFAAAFKETVARFWRLPPSHQEDYVRTLRDQLRDVRRACADQPASTKAHLAGKFKTPIEKGRENTNAL